MNTGRAVPNGRGGGDAGGRGGGGAWGRGSCRPSDPTK